MSTTTVRTCDLCDKIIPEDELCLDAGVYGRDAHMNCFRILTSFEVLGFLGLDDIREVRHSDEQGAMKVTRDSTTRTWKEHVEKRIADLNESITLR